MIRSVRSYNNNGGHFLIMGYIALFCFIMLCCAVGWLVCGLRVGWADDFDHVWGHEQIRNVESAKAGGGGGGDDCDDGCLKKLEN